jgi:hypothetical protein
MLSIPVVHPTLGTSRQTTPQHVVDWMFASRRPNQLPPDVLVGPSIWEDPRYLPAESDESNDESDEAPKVVHPSQPERLTTRSVKRAASPPPAQITVSRVCLKSASAPTASLGQTPEHHRTRFSRISYLMGGKTDRSQSSLLHGAPNTPGCSQPPAYHHIYCPTQRLLTVLLQTLVRHRHLHLPMWVQCNHQPPYLHWHQLQPRCRVQHSIHWTLCWHLLRRTMLRTFTSSMTRRKLSNLRLSLVESTSFGQMPPIHAVIPWPRCRGLPVDGTFLHWTIICCSLPPVVRRRTRLVEY